MTNITQDQLDAAEEAFGSYPKPEPYIGMRILVGSKFMTYHKGHDLVYQAIKRVPGAKDDDGLLYAVIVEGNWDSRLSVRENMMRAPRSENLTRRRRDLRLMKLIEDSPQSRKRREKAFKNERERHSPIPPQLKAHDEFMSTNKGHSFVAPQVEKIVTYNDNNTVTIREYHDAIVTAPVFTPYEQTELI